MTSQRGPETSAPGRDLHRYRRDQLEQGSASAFTVGLFFALALCGGLVVDGGRMVATRATAADHAENAARFGAQEVTVTGGVRRIDVGRATAAARRYLASRGQRGSVSASSSQVVVTVTATTRMSVLRLIGVGSKTARVTRSAQVVDR